MKVKILSESNYVVLERVINEIIEEHKNEEVIDIKFDTKDELYSAMIIFK